MRLRERSHSFGLAGYRPTRFQPKCNAVNIGFAPILEGVRRRRRQTPGYTHPPTPSRPGKKTRREAGILT